jgi:curved DNA-binding protein CbpA
MTAKPDYYQLLGVSPESTLKQIKSAYHQLALKLHPDHGGTAAGLAAVNEAADVLTDPKRREAYDLDRRLAAKGGAFSNSRQAKTTEPEAKRPRQKVSVVLCDFCDTMNRVKDDPDYVPATCGHCGRSLGKAGRAPEPPVEPPKPQSQKGQPAPADQEKLDSYAKLLSDTANQLFNGGLKHAAKNLPGADKILEGLQEMTDHLASRVGQKDEPKPATEQAQTRLDEMENYLHKLKKDGG